MEETQIVRMNSQLRGPGLLEQVVRGNEEAARTMQELVQENCIKPNSLPDVFFASVAGASALKSRLERAHGDETVCKPMETARRETHTLASIAACKINSLCPETIIRLHGRLTSALRNPEQADTAAMKLLIDAEMVLIGQKIVRNGKLVELVEAIADGLAKTKDPAKRNMLFGFGRVVRKRWPIELDKVYECIFDITTTKNMRKEDSAVIILTSLMRKHERGELRFGEVVEKRMQGTLEKINAPLSDGDANLPKAHIKKTLLQRAKEALSIRKRPGQLAHTARQ